MQRYIKLHILVILTLFASQNSIAQESPNETFVRLSSDDVQMRSKAFWEIVEIPKEVESQMGDLSKYARLKTEYQNNDKAKIAIFKLADLELKKSKSISFVSTKDLNKDELAEGYANYLNAVFCALGNMKDTRAIPLVLAYGGYDSLERLADLGEPVVGPILDEFDHGSGEGKSAAIVALVAMAKISTPKYSYSADSRRKIKQAFVKAGGDADEFVRRVSVAGFKELILKGDVELIETLKKMAKDDLGKQIVNNKIHYQVREKAQKALEEIKKNKTIQKRIELLQKPTTVQ